MFEVVLGLWPEVMLLLLHDRERPTPRSCDVVGWGRRGRGVYVALVLAFVQALDQTISKQKREHRHAFLLVMSWPNSREHVFLAHCCLRVLLQSLLQLLLRCARPHYLYSQSQSTPFGRHGKVTWTKGCPRCNSKTLSSSDIR